MNAETFLPLLICALNRVHQHYYRHELWREPEWLQMFEGHEGNGNIQELKVYLDRYGERVFCYELYHQIRLLMEEPDSDGTMFQAELKKDTLHQIRQFFPEIIRGLDKAYIPDFLLHAPGNFEHQELIMEVKSNPHITRSDIEDDLKKIDEFISRFRYRVGLFLSVNTRPDHIIGRLLHTERERNWMEENLPQRNRIIVICKPSQDEPHTEWHLGSL